MFYIQLKNRRWNKPTSPVNQAVPTCKPSEVEAINQKSFEFALNKTTEYIRNTK